MRARCNRFAKGWSCSSREHPLHRLLRFAMLCDVAHSTCGASAHAAHQHIVIDAQLSESLDHRRPNRVLGQQVVYGLCAPERCKGPVMWRPTECCRLHGNMNRQGAPWSGSAPDGALNRDYRRELEREGRRCAAAQSCINHGKTDSGVQRTGWGVAGPPPGPGPWCGAGEDAAPSIPGPRTAPDVRPHAAVIRSGSGPLQSRCALMPLPTAKQHDNCAGALKYITCWFQTNATYVVSGLACNMFLLPQICFPRYLAAHGNDISTSSLVVEKPAPYESKWTPARP